MKIVLTPDIEQGLIEQARRSGSTPEELALTVLRQQFAPARQENGGQTLFDFLAGHIGVLSSSEFTSAAGRISEDTGKKFTEGMRAKHRQGEQ